MTANKFFANLVLLSSAIIFTSTAAYSSSVSYAKIKNKSVETKRIYSVEIGEPSFAIGECFSDSMCSISGCSNQLCTSFADLATTCEYSGSYPNAEKFSCGCVEQKCSWFYK